MNLVVATLFYIVYDKIMFFDANFFFFKQITTKIESPINQWMISAKVNCFDSDFSQLYPKESAKSQISFHSLQ